MIKGPEDGKILLELIAKVLFRVTASKDAKKIRLQSLIKKLTSIFLILRSK